MEKTFIDLFGEFLEASEYAPPSEYIKTDINYYEHIFYLEIQYDDERKFYDSFYFLTELIDWFKNLDPKETGIKVIQIKIYGVPCQREWYVEKKGIGIEVNIGDVEPYIYVSAGTQLLDYELFLSGEWLRSIIEEKTGRKPTEKEQEEIYDCIFSVMPEEDEWLDILAKETAHLISLLERNIYDLCKEDYIWETAYGPYGDYNFYLNIQLKTKLENYKELLYDIFRHNGVLDTSEKIAEKFIRIIYDLYDQAVNKCIEKIMK